MKRARIALAVLVGLLLALPASASDDPEWDRQWGPVDIRAPDAWAKTTGKGVLVAIVDSGVDVDHPDLKAKIDPRSWDWGDNDDNPDDDSPLQDGAGKSVKGHGTHVAGTAAAITNNNVGVAGVAPDARILALKVFQSREGGSIIDGLTRVPRAINDAVDKGAKVINLSLGTFKGFDLVGLIESPCAAAFQRGSLCIVAAGNSGQGRPSGYAKNVQFVTVAAHTKKGSPAPFSQRADTQWGVSAPGVDIYNTYPVEMRSYTSAQGTSMAAPHVAGVAALLFAQGLNAAQVVDRMTSTAFAPVGPPGDQGSGRVNAAGAVGAKVTLTDGEIAAPTPTTSRSRTTTAPTAAAKAPDGSAPGSTLAPITRRGDDTDFLDPEAVNPDVVGSEGEDQVAAPKPEGLGLSGDAAARGIASLLLLAVGAWAWTASRARHRTV